MKRKATFDLAGIQKKAPSQQLSTSPLFTLLFTLLIQFPKSLIFLIDHYLPKALVFTFEQWENFENLVDSKWVEFTSRIQREREWNTVSSSSPCRDLTKKISLSFLFPFNSETRKQNGILRELIDLEAECLDWKQITRSAFMDIIREVFTEDPYSKTQALWPNKSIQVPDFLKDCIQKNESIIDLSPTEFLCYYLAWRGDHGIDWILYVDIPYLFGYYFGYKGILWVLFVFLGCYQIEKPPQEREIYPSISLMGWMLEFAYYGAFPSEKIKKCLRGYLSTPVSKLAKE